MITEPLSHYLTTFQSFNQGNTKDYGLAPHKPILVLSILDYIEQQYMITDRVPIDQGLKELFQRNWAWLVTTGHRCNINDPLFHLSTEGFWQAYTTSESGKIDQLFRHFCDHKMVSALAWFQLDSYPPNRLPQSFRVQGIII